MRAPKRDQSHGLFERDNLVAHFMNATHIYPKTKAMHLYVSPKLFSLIRPKCAIPKAVQSCGRNLGLDM